MNYPSSIRSIFRNIHRGAVKGNRRRRMAQAIAPFSPCPELKQQFRAQRQLEYREANWIKA